MKNVLYFLLLILMIAGTACDQDVPGRAQLRIHNQSRESFQEVIIRSPGVNFRFGPITGDGITAYEDLGTIYRYANITVVTETDTLALIPIDYVGETPFTKGNYTYQLAIRSSPRSLQLDFQED